MLNFFNLNVNNKFDINFGSFFGLLGRRKEVLTKDNVNILFIDDLDMPVVESLKKAKYKVKKVRDINNVDDVEVKNAQIIFVDFDGVGRSVSPKHQGAGLVKEIKTKYRESKYVVLYTVQSIPADTTMNSLFNMADAKMRKDSDFTDFTEQIREAIKTIK